MSKDRLSFWPWSRSATGMWGEGTGLGVLRNYAKGKSDASGVAEALWEPGIDVQNSAICELLAHGNVRQAAELARELTRQHPVCEDSIRQSFADVADTLLKADLDSLPSKPSEYPPHIEKEYIQ